MGAAVAVVVAARGMPRRKVGQGHWRQGQDQELEQRVEQHYHLLRRPHRPHPPLPPHRRNFRPWRLVDRPCSLC